MAHECIYPADTDPDYQAPEEERGEYRACTNDGSWKKCKIYDGGENNSGDNPGLEGKFHTREMGVSGYCTFVFP